ncbi:Zn(II)2Cys6 transcription factor domain-containing protein [Aspergillus ruber CBS 135680]|uniref:Zn(2)-C6 fungal-type domain-containing protein n=1 Tax=Aspergillus ruber (strain CBS 135680) TaxID=1388766 RepID=A0A017SJD3_ASPRC|nr:uncharacterized protein EURHEDRAFT_521978 [Aspergillus ruber CBS 135680]EYE96881.1 hypothetical protein EURHEDRAFT_521978 [Aspergillus ruber CBS 135680]
MVFPGNRSTGCHLCRKRKIKCDGAKPECQHCISRGMPCPGYPDPLTFREYRTTRAATRDRRQTKMTTVGREKEQSELAEAQSSSACEPQRALSEPLSPTISSPRPRTGPALSLEWQAVCYFTHHHVLKVHKSPCRGFLAFFPELYKEKGDDSCLKHAVLSVASLSLFNASRVGQLYVNSRRHYGSAIKSLYNALKSNETAVTDEVFAASLFLNVFTDLSGETSDGLNPHIPGTHSLLQLRDKSQLHTKYGRELFGWAITQVQTQAIANNEFRYATLPECIRKMYKPDNVYRAGIIMDMVAQQCYSISEMRATLSNPETPYPSPSSSSPSSLPSTAPTYTITCGIIHRLLIQAHCLIDEIDTWHEAVPNHWKVQYHDVLSNDTIHVKRDQWTTCFLATILSTQIIFYTHLIDFCDLLTEKEIAFDHSHCFEGPVDLFTGLESRIRLLLQMVCSTVSFSLGKVDQDGKFQASSNVKLVNGYVLRLPMRTVVGSRFASKEQVRLCQGALDYVGEVVMGNRLIRKE